MKQTIKKSIGLGLLVSVGLALAACAPTGNPPQVQLPDLPTTPEPRTVQVSASGTAEAEPDTVLLLLGVETSNDDAQDAIDANNDQMTSVQEALVDMGVAEQNIQTVQFDVSIERFRPEEGPGEGGTEIQRFRVVHLVQVRSGEIDAAGNLLQSALDAGANIVRDVRFTIDDPTELRQQARADALDAARMKARELASGLDAELGPPRRIQEGGTGPVPVQAAAQVERAQAEAPIAAGTLTITVNVDVTFDLLVD